MNTAIANTSEFRNLPLDYLIECPLNPRRIVDEAALNELAESIRTQGVLSPLLVRPVNPQTYEVVAGKRRFRASKLAGVESVPVDIRELNDAQCLEIAIVENLQRRDVHPLEEAEGFASLLRLEEPKYSIEQIAAKCGKHPGYVLSRMRLTELAPAVVEAFTKTRSVWVMRCCLRSCSRNSKNKPCPLAGRRPTARGASRNGFCCLCAISANGSNTTSCLSLPPLRSPKKTHS